MMEPNLRSGNGRCRGVVLIGAMGVFLVLAILAAIAAGVLPAVQQGSFLSADSTAAFYGADSGIEMALKERSAGVDLDGDGSVGGISSDGVSPTDPPVGDARIHVDADPSGILTATGVCRDARRRVEVVVQ